MSRRREALHTKTFTQVQMQMNSGAPSSQAGTEFGTELRGISVILCSLDSKWFTGDLYHLPSIFRRTVSSQGFFLTQDLENHVKFEPRLFLMGNQTDFLERGKKKQFTKGSNEKLDTLFTGMKTTKPGFSSPGFGFLIWIKTSLNWKISKLPSSSDSLRYHNKRLSKEPDKKFGRCKKCLAWRRAE